MEEEPPGDEKNRDAFARYGMVDVEEWCFEQVSPGQLKVVPCPSLAAAASTHNSGLSMLGMPGFIPPQSTAIPLQVRQYLGISRPSAGVDEAVVTSGMSMPMAAEGGAVLWKRQADGSWQPTQRVITRWIS